MIVEILAVGTELLLGDIVNSNAAVIGHRLGEEGFDIHYQVVVGDNLARVVEALRTAAGRSDAVVITGGIGPTQDDLTREALCALAGVAMTRDEAHASWIDTRIRGQGREPSPSVLRMADLPAGAEGLPNVNGVALGVAIEHDGRWLFAMPGVPAEMVPMLDHEVMPRLRRLAGKPAALRSRVLHCWGLGESAIADKLDDLFASSNPSVAFLIRDMEVRVRITAKAEDESRALTLIEPVESEDQVAAGRPRLRRGRARLWSASCSTESPLPAGRWPRPSRRLWGRWEDVSLLPTPGRPSSVASSVGTGMDRSLQADVLLEVGPIGPDQDQRGADHPPRGDEGDDSARRADPCLRLRG